jgi:hypothetical protein
VTISVSPGLARDEALQNCRKDWRTSQAALRANGINQKTFIADCQAAAAAARSGAATSPGSADAQPKPGSAPLPPANAGETSKVKACVEEWRTKRRTKRGTDELQGLTEKTYIEQCRRGSNSPASNLSFAPMTREGCAIFRSKNRFHLPAFRSRCTNHAARASRVYRVKQVVDGLSASAVFTT